MVMFLKNITVNQVATITKICTSDNNIRQYFAKVGICVGAEIELKTVGLFKQNALFLVYNRLINIPSDYQKLIAIQVK